MAQWRIRLAVPDDPGGLQALKGALAAVPSARVLDPPGGAAGTGRDVIVDLREDSLLGDLLRTLHEISPQVFVSRVPSAEQAAAPGIRVRRLRGTVSVVG